MFFKVIENQNTRFVSALSIALNLSNSLYLNLMKYKESLSKFFLLFLVMIVLVQGTRYSFVVCFYELNKDYISQFLCEKKAEINNHCQGNCYLQKKLHENESSSSEILRILKFVEVEVLNSFTKLDLQVYWHDIIFSYSIYLLESYSASLQSVFRPPAHAS